MEQSKSCYLCILIPTHILPSAPATKIIQTTLNSLAEIKDLQGCDCFINCDLDTTKKEIGLQYIKNLNKLSSPFNIRVSYSENAQQRFNVLNLIYNKWCYYKYFLFIEHDWIFIELPPLNKIMEVMDKYPQINVIYFNKRPNLQIPYPAGDFILEPATEITELPLLKTSKWSNNPHIVRSAVWKKWWYSELQNAPINRANPRKQIETILHYHYIQDIQERGFAQVHAKWGMYSYGELNKNKMVEHLDGRNFRQ